MTEVSDKSVWCDEISLDDARLYLLFLNHRGHKDWRLPTALERMILPEFSKTGGYWYSFDLDSTNMTAKKYTLVPVRDC